MDEEMGMVCRTWRSGETKYQNDLQLKYKVEILAGRDH